jgi:hypothetical protein
MDVPGYESYRDALRAIELARETIRTAGLDITQYEEHADSRELMAKAAVDLVNAEKAFEKKQFINSGIVAQHSIGKVGKAHQLALDVRRAYQEKREAETAEVLSRLEMMLKKVPAKLTSDQQTSLERAEEQLRLGRLMEAEGGWGYAQMHGYIGMGMLKRL